jgi:hypothetical protein
VLIGHPHIFSEAWNSDTHRWEALGLICFWGSLEVSWRAWRLARNHPWEIELTAPRGSDADILEVREVLRQIREVLDGLGSASSETGANRDW